MTPPTLTSTPATESREQGFQQPSSTGSTQGWKHCSLQSQPAQHRSITMDHSPKESSPLPPPDSHQDTHCARHWLLVSVRSSKASILALVKQRTACLQLKAFLLPCVLSLHIKPLLQPYHNSSAYQLVSLVFREIIQTIPALSERVLGVPDKTNLFGG